MPTYQPSQILTWKYSTGTGQLSIVSTITISLQPGEYVTASSTAPSNGSASITLTVTNVSSLFPPVVIPYAVHPGLTTKTQVRAFIQTLNPVNVKAKCYKNSILVGENESACTTGAEIELIS
jgi:hypothetical protein